MTAHISLASSRRLVGQGAAQKTARKKIKKTRREEAIERLLANLTRGRSGIPESGISPDWSILTDFVITDADEIYDMAAVGDLSTSNAVFKSVINNKL